MSAEQQFREAFERLKGGTSIVLPEGTPVTQNNVAKEAGKDPSALRKTRFPTLIAEIQRYVSTVPSQQTDSRRQAILKSRQRNRSLKEQLVDTAKQRDILASLLVDADQKILELQDTINRLEKEKTPSNVKKFPGNFTSRNPKIV